jgi:pyruvate dehydrogenase (quinone)
MCRSRWFEAEAARPGKDMTETAATFLATILEKACVKRVYGVAGGSFNDLTDALRRRGRIQWVHVRHEEAAVFAASAEAQLTGKLAVCAGRCGPGDLHLINGLYDCYRSSVPVLAIAAHIPSREIGADFFQATHPENLFAECSHYVELVSNVEQLPQIVERALRVAIAKKGVAVVVIPGDIASTPLDAEVPKWIAPTQPQLHPDPFALVRLADFLNAARRLTILAGVGCVGARPEVLALAERLKAPIVHTMRAKEFLEFDNPFDVGMAGSINFSSGYHAVNECDTLLMLGTDFPYRQFYPEPARVIQVDVRPEALGNRTSLAFGLLGDVGLTLRALMPHVTEVDDGTHLAEAKNHHESACKYLDVLSVSEIDSTVIHPQFVTRLVSKVADDDAIFTCDVGAPTVWAARYLKMKGTRRLLGPLNHGSLANALPQAIGAQASHPGRQVVSLSGDGGFSTLMGDFITLTQMGLPVKVVLLNNGTVGLAELEMKGAGFLDTDVELKNQNVAAIAETMGMKGIRIERPQDLLDALGTTFKHDGPTLIDVVTARHPPNSTSVKRRSSECS